MIDLPAALRALPTWKALMITAGVSSIITAIAMLLVVYPVVFARYNLGWYLSCNQEWGTPTEYGLAGTPEPRDGPR